MFITSMLWEVPNNCFKISLQKVHTKYLVLIQIFLNEPETNKNVLQKYLKKLIFMEQ